MAKKSYPNSGILSRDKKRKSDKHPEFTGSAEVDGVEYWLSAWVNESEHGKYFKISFKPKDGQKAAGEHSQVREPGDEDDDTPF